MVFDEDDSDSDSEPAQNAENPAKVEEFPALKQDQQKQSRAEPLNYSRLLSSSMPEEKPKAVVLAVAVKETPLPKLKIPFESQKGKLNWATAESDSEGDEEEEDAYVPPKKAVQKEELGAW